jgi:serine/threonine protein kinase
MTALGPGDRIDRYTIEAPIGEGGMGRVYRAYDERLDRRVAVKIVAANGETGGDDREAHKRLLREARAASKLDHPNVVAVFDVGETAEGPYIVMELVPGRSLRELIDADDAAERDRVRILRDTAIALAAAHEAGIVHRDVKPENVIVRPDGRVKVLDFGIARAVPRDATATLSTAPNLATLTQDGAKLGTPRYMAPEQIKGGPVDGRSDQFAWAVCAFELLEGRPPFRGPDPMAVMAAVLTDAAPPMARVSAELAAIVARALEKDPSRRFTSMRDLLAALEALGVDAVPSAQPRRFQVSEPPVSPTNPTLHAPARPTTPSPGASVASSKAATPRPPPQLSRRYTAMELEEIFDRALAVQRTGYSFEDVASAGREIGIDHQSMQQAMSQLERRGAVAPRATWRSANLRGFYRHAGIWLAVSFGLFLMNVFDPSSVWWFQWTMISWGIAVGIHAVVAFTRATPEKKPLQRQSPDPMVAYDAAQVAQYLDAEGAAPRVRIGDRRSGHDRDVEAEAEAEAEAYESERRGRRQRR